MANRVYSGSCLCEAVRYDVTGELRDVMYCHCEQCRRTSGHFVAATACAKKDLTLTKSEGLRWYRSSAEAERGFCVHCGSSLFWRTEGRDAISIMAGTLDGPTGLKATSHIFVANAGDYYSLDDGLPKSSGYEDTSTGKNP